MIAQQVAKKYSNALFMSTVQRGLVDEAYEQFSRLRDVLEQDASLLKFLSNPKIEEEQKLGVIRSVFGARMEQLFVEFLAVLVRKRRAMYLVEIIDEFDRHVEFEKGIVRATAITAVPLAPSEVDSLRTTLATRTGKQIEMETKVDTAIIGGMVVVMADEIIDGSVKYGLDQLEEKLQKIKVH
jgi:F-type H+-transporting ATPase subunit delta